MEIRNAISPQEFKGLNTGQLREQLLVSDLFRPGEQKFVYTHFDRMIIGGIIPQTSLTLPDGREVTGTDYFLERREAGVLNVGGPGKVTVDGKEYALGYKDLLYVGMGAREVQFSSDDPQQLAEFYLVSTTAHHPCPTQKIEFDSIEPIELGSSENASKRVLRKYLLPETQQTSQLTMGMTSIEPGNVWCNIPGHTHARKTEVFLIFELDAEEIVLFVVGEPTETRHLVVKNEEAVIVPGWSVHPGVGTGNYTLLWAMAGENQVFSDANGLPMKDLK